ncbi:MAG: SDR family oxidoreductase [Pseudomonadota bacterium]
MRLAGRNAVVTGASSGIGRAVAIKLAAEGAAVVVNYRSSEDAALACVQDINAAGGTANALQADVANKDDVARLVNQANDMLSGVDIWANVAGADILTGSGSALADSDKLRALLDVDLQGTINCCWAAEHLLRESTCGAVINMSWDLALRGMAGRNPEMFAATKAGISGFTRSFARSVAPHFRVNEVAPGWIATAFAEQEMRDDYRQAIIDQTPLARLGQPADVANAVAFLASDEASFITGQTLNVNGGLSS